MEIRCAIYARYSSNNQREASIEDQIRKCKELAASKGWIVLNEHIYFDKAQSGTQIDSRINFKRMLRVAMSENCPFQKILVDDTSRIARNTKEALNIFSLLNFYGIHIYYVAQGIDTADETAEEMITINGLIDSIYIRNLAKETHRGIEGQVLKGFSAGGKRYGYYSVPVYNGKVDIYGNPLADGYILKINPEEAETVIRIFKLFGEEGYSAKKIANLLNRELKQIGKPKPPRGNFWTVSTIIGSKKSLRGILNNEIYIGRYRWNRTSVRRNPENGTKKRILKDNSKWVEIIKPELRIINDELWEKVKQRQRYLKEAANGKYVKAKKVYSKNLFTGFISCGLCNGNIVVVSGGKYAKYGCSNNWNKGSSVCENTLKIDKSKLEIAIFDALKFDLSEKKSVDYVFTKVSEIVNSKLSEEKEDRMADSLKEQLKKINKEIENYINAIKFGIITETVKNQLISAERKREEIESKIRNLNNKIVQPPYITYQMISDYLKNLQSTISFHTVLGRDFLSQIIDKITLKPDKDKIEIIIFTKPEGTLSGKSIQISLDILKHEKIQIHHEKNVA